MKSRIKNEKALFEFEMLQLYLSKGKRKKKNQVMHIFFAATTWYQNLQTHI